MNTVTTKITTQEGTITHQGTSGFTVTAIREGNDVDTLIEYSEVEVDEMREMVGVLLCILEHLEGEQFVASCFARYAQEMGKKFFEYEDGRKLVIMRGKGGEKGR